MIEIRELTKSFGERVAVDHLSLSIEKGEFFALLGSNGAGKTTTIKMISGLQTPTNGDIIIDGMSIFSNLQQSKQLMNISPQETAVAPNLSVKENLEFTAKIYGFDKNEAIIRAGEMMEKFSLTDRAKAKAKTLSGGLQRRLSIAMAMISNPRIVFLDEPTLGLDVRARRDLWNILLGLKGQMTIILTTHYLEEVEALADRVGIMHHGKLCALGTVDDLKEQYNKNSLEEVFLSVTEEMEVLV
ncbi:ABC transporter ATP-binding protein [Ureibacillus acetophenoni]|uniref:ABC-2 type transport system ATP-binding protein n=1 Tax=Ureibacillus acetophenoni TaxID=614649 RepID=A0A285UJ21_9BACL|nr:ABC transporter ATP-binding protein [Ureibacillus acetophenoni]SOC41802.1 ABC-2 type transport system ATP-binding protein [Ureibacillus acetophenoni]